jgi:HEAT repeat protein
MMYMPVTGTTWTPGRTTTILSALVLAALAPAARLAGQEAPATPQTPLAYLTAMLADEKTANPTLATLRSTEDKTLGPLFTAASHSADKERRLFAVISLGDLMGKDASAALIDRLNNEPVMAVRAEALGQLVKVKAMSAEQLAQTLRMPDENIQCLSALALVEAGKQAVATDALKALAAAKDPLTTALASVTLWGLGQNQYAPAVQKVMRDPATEPRLHAAMLKQIEMQKIAGGVPLALEVAANEQAPLDLRALAFKTVANVSTTGAATLGDAIAKSDNMALRVRLMKTLASREDGGPFLQKIAKGTDPVAALARYELARRTGGPTAGPSVSEALAQEHPVVIAYVLDRSREDIEAKGAKCDYYTSALAKLVGGIDPRPARMGREHFYAAGAASRLLELGTPAALAALKGLLTGKANAITRATAAGLLRAKNPAACELLRPLLASPYPELAMDAALGVGHFGDPAARPLLNEVLTHAKQHPTALVVLSAWYILKIDKQTQPAVAALAKVVK